MRIKAMFFAVVIILLAGCTRSEPEPTDSVLPSAVPTTVWVEPEPTQAVTEPSTAPAVPSLGIPEDSYQLRFEDEANDA